MAYQTVEKYEILLDGNNNAVPQFNMMQVRMKTSSGYHQYEYSCNTEHAFEKIKMIIDLLRNEDKVRFDPVKNVLRAS